MAIPLRQIPANLLVPGQYQEIDNSLAGAQGDIKKALVIGCCLSGCQTAGVPVQALSAQKGHELFGYGSPVAIMAETFLSLNKAEELWALPVPEPEAGTAWKKTSRRIWRRPAIRAITL